MKITLNKPLTFTEIGRKDNQEDRIYPPMSKLSTMTTCFVLCDGMGGHENGEVAAEIVASNLQPRLMEGKTEPDIITVKRFNTALIQTYKKLDEMPVTSGKIPGTTMTCLYIAENAVLAAHIGDSRIYQIRPGEGIIFKSRDHSLVNDLLRAGEITEEEAETFPRKNVITRAMQPRLERPYRADVALLTDVKGGDFFFMCSDGIIETVKDDKLNAILSDTNISDDEKLNAIYDICYGNTRDNYTCILIPVAEVSGEPLPTPEEEDHTKVVTTPSSSEAPAASVSSKHENSDTIPTLNHPTSNPMPKQNKTKTSLKDLLTLRNILICLGFIIVVVVIACICTSKSDKKGAAKDDSEFIDQERPTFEDEDVIKDATPEDGEMSRLDNNETGLSDEQWYLDGDNPTGGSGKGGNATGAGAASGTKGSAGADDGPREITDGTDNGSMTVNSKPKAQETGSENKTTPEP